MGSQLPSHGHFSLEDLAMNSLDIALTAYANLVNKPIESSGLLKNLLHLSFRTLCSEVDINSASPAVPGALLELPKDKLGDDVLQAKALDQLARHIGSLKYTLNANPKIGNRCTRLEHLVQQIMALKQCVSDIPDPSSSTVKQLELVGVSSLIDSSQKLPSKPMDDLKLEFQIDLDKSGDYLDYRSLRFHDASARPVTMSVSCTEGRDCRDGHNIGNESQEREIEADKHEQHEVNPDQDKELKRHESTLHHAPSTSNREASVVSNSKLRKAANMPCPYAGCAIFKANELNDHLLMVHGYYDTSSEENRSKERKVLKRKAIPTLKEVLSRDRALLNRQKDRVRRIDAAITMYNDQYTPTHGLPVQKPDENTDVAGMAGSKNSLVNKIVTVRKALYELNFWEEEWEVLVGMLRSWGGAEADLGDE